MSSRRDMPTPHPDFIPALVPRHGQGHQFVCYADCCSGVPGAAHESTFAAINNVVDRLRPRPQFICFPGDEIQGLTTDTDELRRQWRYWLDEEMSWLDRKVIPIYHTTGNHTTYDAASEWVFREMLPHLPNNGPPGQEGLSYFVRHDDLLLIFVNTTWSGLGGEGRVETEWLERTLSVHQDATYKLVVGHHPVHPVNGFSGPFQREIDGMQGQLFWDALVKHQVLAYLCSHILAFDVQVHQGVLQILTAGAGTAHRMPEGIEYLHCMQAALDTTGLRYQVLDSAGRLREWLAWPPVLPDSESWMILSAGEQPAPWHEPASEAIEAWLEVWRFRGRSTAGESGRAQTLLAAWSPGPALEPLWIGLLGPEQRVCVLLSPEAGRSPHLWRGPQLAPDQAFDFQLAVHAGMGPGGILWRSSDESTWTSLAAASPWGGERLPWPERWSVGQGKKGEVDRPFRGQRLTVSGYHQRLKLEFEPVPVIKLDRHQQ